MLSENATQTLSVIKAAPIVPVLVVEDIRHAAPLVKTLSDAGLTAVEVTLRTAQACDVIREMKSAAPEVRVGAGTVKTAVDIESCLHAGADFIVTPGTTPSLAAELSKLDILVTPGAGTVGEAMALLENGFTYQKFFPAEVCGGVGFLKSIASPVPEVQFMPTGGVRLSNLNDYLSLPNVFAVGGTWIATTQDLVAQDWQAVRLRAQLALKTISGEAIEPA